MSQSQPPEWHWQRPPEPQAPYSQPLYPQQPYLPYQVPPQPVPPPVPQRRGPGVLTVALGVAGGILLLIVVCCGALAVMSGLGASARTHTTPSPPARVGDTITVSGVACTLVSVAPLAGDEFLQPKAGNTYIVVRVRLINQSSDTISYNEFDFKVTSGAGNATGPEIPPSTYASNRLLDSGQLAAGGSVTGDVVFQVPQHDHGATLSWEPSFFSSLTDNVWNLGL